MERVADRAGLALCRLLRSFGKGTWGLWQKDAHKAHYRGVSIWVSTLLFVLVCGQKYGPRIRVGQRSGGPLAHRPMKRVSPTVFDGRPKGVCVRISKIKEYVQTVRAGVRELTCKCLQACLPAQMVLRKSHRRRRRNTPCALRYRCWNSWSKRATSAGDL